jgi:N-acetylmuramoyl-L-alanine amidase
LEVHRKLPLLVLFTIILFSFPEKMHAKGAIKVTIDTLNVRADAGITFPIIDQIHEGDTFDIVDEKGSWIKIKLSSNEKGWVAAWLVDRISSVAVTKVHSNVNGLNVRSGPSTSYNVIAKINPNETFTYISEQGKWTKIDYEGTEAWVASWLISTTKIEKNDEVIKTAIIDVDLLNIRQSPSISGAILGRLAKGTTVAITDVKAGWYKINFKNTIGWIAGDYVKSVNAEQEAKVTADILNIRSEPTTSSAILGKLVKDSVVTIIGEREDWKQIVTERGTKGWIAGWFLTTEKEEILNVPSIKVINNGTNIRAGASTRTNVVLRANAGDEFAIVSKHGDWYEISIGENETAFIASWIVTTTNLVGNDRTSRSVLQGKTIVLDPGHGGRDSGAIGVTGVLEKDLTIHTALLLKEALTNAGATVILTHNGDRYVSLENRVITSHYNKADAFISIHFNSSFDASAGGISSYYFNTTDDKKLAEKIHNQLIAKTGLRDRRAQYGNYHVLRRNNQPAVLLELGFISKAKEEAFVKTKNYQQIATDAIYQGLLNFFK